jgi:hypothetical protein
MNTTFIFMPYEIILENSLFSITLGKKNINKEKGYSMEENNSFP